MTSEIKNCQNCKKDFTIEPEDLAFYKKIKVPPPTWCPECRLIRRMVWMNHQALYQRACDSCHKVGISMFSPEYTGKAYCSVCWWADTFDAMAYAREYDFTRTFFEQWHELMLEVPQRSLIVTYPTLENSEYANHAAYLKNCYLVISSDNNENCAYGTCINGSKDTFDSTFTTISESCYECLDCTRCYKTFFSENCETCSDVWFSKNCIGCNDCIGCINLKNKQYYIFNEHYSKEDYEKKRAELDLNSYQSLQKLREQCREIWQKHPHRFYYDTHNDTVSGNSISHSKNAHDCFKVVGGEDIRYCQILLTEPTKESYDYTIWGMNAELIYECVEIGYGPYNTKFSISSDENLRDSQYCLNCFSSSNLFGCVGLRNAKYCIFNKQYTKDEYDALVSRIIEHMNLQPYADQEGRIYRYGEFFPPIFSPYAYNESMAQEYFPLTKEQALESGLHWLSSEHKEIPTAIQPKSLPDTVRDVVDSITRSIIECEHDQTCNELCTGAFKITSMELGFYRTMNLPLPHLCPNCRHYKRIKYRNPMKLWERQCMCESGKHDHLDRCSAIFQTSYAPERSEIVYCEECYGAEIL